MNQLEEGHFGIKRDIMTGNRLLEAPFCWDMATSDIGTEPEVTKPKQSRSFDQIMKLKPKPKLGLYESTKLKLTL